MPLDAQNPNILPILVERVEELIKAVAKWEGIAMTVNTNTVKITELEKDNSGHHKAIQESSTFAATAKGGIKVLYAVILIFAGFISGIGATAVIMFFQDSKAISSLTTEVQDLRADVNLLQGVRK